MKILLAEDEQDLNKALVAILQHSGYDVVTVYDGEAALNKAMRTYFDAIILDIMMPKLDGLSVLEELRAAGKNTPVLMLTAKATSDDLVTGLDVGADDYLTKPFVMKELLARIRVLVRRKSLYEQGRLEFNDITLKRESSELAQSDANLVLSKIEYAIMEMLIENTDDPLKEDAIIERLNNSIDKYALNVYMNYLRNKLCALNSIVCIYESNNTYILVTENTQED